MESICRHKILIKDASVCIANLTIPPRKCFECNTILSVDELIDRVLESFLFMRDQIEFIVETFNISVYDINKTPDSQSQKGYKWVFTNRGIMRRRYSHQPKEYIKDGPIYKLSSLQKLPYIYVVDETFPLMDEDGLSISTNTVMKTVEKCMSIHFSKTMSQELGISSFYVIYNEILDFVEDAVFKGQTEIHIQWRHL